MSVHTTDDDETETEDQRNLRIANRSQRIRTNVGGSFFTSENEKTVVLSIDGFSMKKTDITDQVREAKLGAHKDGYDKYKDHQYLAERANMKIDDPKFDADFFGPYFRRIDERISNKGVNKGLSRSISELVKPKNETQEE